MNKLINVMDDLKATFNTNMDTYAKYQGAINARTQGSNKTWQGMEDSLGKSIGTTPYVKLQSVYENLSKLVDAGIVYNVEQRAFLQTIAADIATTFNAANGTLLRLIRVQHSDTTAARLGMEAALTNYLNKNTYDTEYLNSEFGDVSTALLEASAQMSDQQAVEFEYVVQKWLGSLSSLGLSDEAVTNIAKAIGYLGSGDIESLNSNTAVQNLLVMASNKAGLNYSDMLTRGLDASTTNKLLKSIVTYIQEIASSDNKVVKSEYANVFGLSASDLTAVKNNLTSKQINNISASMMSYKDTLSELGNQLNQIPTRISLAEMLSNLFDNAIWGLSSNIAESPVLYSL
jgi:signal transduction histidine kinase